MKPSIRRSRGVHNPDHSICLGVIVKPHFGCDAEAMRALRQDPRIELAPAQSGGIPGCLITKIGHDQQLLEELAALPSVLAVEVVYAQELAPDSEEVP